MAASKRQYVRLYQGPGGLKSKRFPVTATKTEIKQWKEDTRVAARKQPKVRAARGTLAEDVARYLKLVATMPSITDRTRDLQAWVAVLGMRPRSQLTRQDYQLQLQEWRLRGGRDGAPLAASTVNHRRTALMHLYSTVDGKGAPNPLRDIPPFPEPPPEPRDIGIENARAIIAAMPRSKTRARVKVLAWTGVRGRSEIGPMKPAHVNLTEARCWVPTGKGGKPRQLPLNADGIDAWQEFIDLKAWGFYSKDGLRHSFHRAVKKVNAARVTSGLPGLPPGIRPYDLRHTIATALRRAGADLADVQAHLGHSSPRMTQRYAPYDATKLTEALRRIR
jgi:integrase